MFRIFLFAALWMMSSARSLVNTRKQDSCGSIHPWHRVECGWEGITKDRCLEFGCCFDPTHRYSLWCFQKEQRATENNNITKLETAGAFVRTCSLKSSERADCGWAGIHQNVCELRGCCYDDQTLGSYWCYHPETRFTISAVEKVMRCVSQCASYTWKKTVQLGTACATDIDCWLHAEDVVAATCVSLCKSNSTMLDSLKNISSCLQNYGIDGEKAMLACEFDTDCWARKFGGVSAGCLMQLSRDANMRRPREESQQFALQPDPPGEMRPVPREAPVEPEQAGSRVIPPQEHTRTDADVEKSRKTLTVLTADEDPEPWWEQ